MLLRIKNKGSLKKCVCICTGYFCQLRKNSSSFSFLFHFGENILVDRGRKYLNPTIYFPSSPPNQTHSKKVFPPIFSPKFSSTLLYLQQTHPKINDSNRIVKRDRMD